MTMNASRRRGPRRRFIYFSAALLFLCGTLVCASRSYIKPYFSAPLEAPFGEFDPSDRARPKTEELRRRQVSIYILWSVLPSPEARAASHFRYRQSVKFRPRHSHQQLNSTQLWKNVCKVHRIHWLLYARRLF